MSPMWAQSMEEGIQAQLTALRFVVQELAKHSDLPEIPESTIAAYIQAELDYWADLQGEPVPRETEQRFTALAMRNVRELLDRFSPGTSQSSPEDFDLSEYGFGGGGEDLNGPEEKPAPSQHDCTCGIPVSRAARLCTERDCPWK